MEHWSVGVMIGRNISNLKKYVFIFFPILHHSINPMLQIISSEHNPESPSGAKPKACP
jgi:hypothetical protein